MKVVAISAAALAASSCRAFAPSNLPAQTRPVNSRSTSPLNSQMAIAAKLPDPYRNLPWNVEREEKRRERRLAVENAALFRELGLPENATYEDVALKTKHLISLTEDMPKNEGIKRKIQIEIARDKIYQIRLNERITGVRLEQEDAARVSKLEEKGVDGLAELGDSVDDIIKPKSKLRVPVISPLIEYTRSIIVPPDDKYRNRQLTIWGLSTLVCLIVPSLTEGFARVNWMPAGGMMGYRGMPIPEGEGRNPFRGRRNKSHQVKAMGIAIFCWVWAKAFGAKVVATFPALAASRSAAWFEFAVVQATMGTVTAFVQTYKEGEEGKDLLI